VRQTEPGHGRDEMLPGEPAALDKARLGLEGFTAPDDYPALVAALGGRGYADERLAAITSENWLRILSTTLPAAAGAAA